MGINYYIYIFYQKIKSNSLPLMQLHSYSPYKPFFEVIDAKEAINNPIIPELPIIVPPETIESIFTIEDTSPIIIESSPELLSVSCHVHETLPLIIEVALLLGFIYMLVYINKWVYKDAAEKIQIIEDLDIGEHVYGPSIYPRSYMDIDTYVPYDLIVYLYTNYNATNDFAKVWFVIFNSPFVYFSTVYFLEKYIFMYYLVVFGITTDANSYIEVALTPPPPPFIYPYDWSHYPIL